MTLPPYAILTKVLDPRHTLILEDWLEFLRHPPAEMVVYIGDDPEIRRKMDELARKSRLPWTAVVVDAGDDLRRHETAILKRMVARTQCEYLLLTTLDALPYRSGSHEEDWLNEVFHRLKSERFVYFSACGVIFRGDRLEESGKYLVTQRFSNNCGLVPREYWLGAVEQYPESLLPPGRSRTHPEWAIETALRERGDFGLRRLETMDWRVFHVQQWDVRLFETRELFRRGVGVDRYLNRVWEDLRFPVDEFYNYPGWLKLKQRMRSVLFTLRKRARRIWQGHLSSRRR